MAKASNKDLALLHKRVAETLLASLNDSETASDLLNEYGDELPSKVKYFLEEISRVNPALLTVATKFLKDNDISADGADEDLDELQSKLNNKRRANISSLPILE